jgi:transposase
MPRAYSEEFRERAVAMVLQDGSPLREVAKSLGVSVSGLDRWVRQARIDRGLPTGSKLPTSEVAAENALLRKQLRQAREELEIVKRAAALFARDNVLPK